MTVYHYLNPYIYIYNDRPSQAIVENYGIIADVQGRGHKTKDPL
jgi:hypothetical protein